MNSLESCQGQARAVDEPSRGAEGILGLALHRVGSLRLLSWWHCLLPAYEVLCANWLHCSGSGSCQDFFPVSSVPCSLSLCCHHCIQRTWSGSLPLVFSIYRRETLGLEAWSSEAGSDAPIHASGHCSLAFRGRAAPARCGMQGSSSRAASGPAAPLPRSLLRAGGCRRLRPPHTLAAA